MPRDQNDPPFRYAGFPSPNGTVVPDDVFDLLMPELSEAELRVLLYIIRRTFGFKKNSDAISLSQMVAGVTTRDGRVLDRGTGMSRRGVMKGCAGLIEKGVIRVEKRLSEQGDNEINIYHLRFLGESRQLDTPVPEVGNVVPYGREPSAPPVGNDVPPQQTGQQQTERQGSNIRMSLHKGDDQLRSPEPVEQRGRRTTRDPVSADARRDVVSLGEAIEHWRRQQVDEEAGERRADDAGADALTARGDPSTDAGRPWIPRPVDAPQVAGKWSGGATAPRRNRWMPHHDEAYQVIQTYIADFARELNDRAPLKSSTMRAYNLYKRSGLSQSVFIEQLYAARAIVKERSSSIRSKGDQSQAGLPTKHKAAYYFAVLEDLLDLQKNGEASGRAAPIE